MANCHNTFSDYLNELNLTATQEERLRQSRDALIDRISAKFKKAGLKIPEYESQGSYALGTQNRPLSDDFDLDHGVYLVHLDDQAPLTVEQAFKLVRDAVDGHNLARHLLGWPWLFRSKAEGLANHVRSHAPNTLVGFDQDDFRSPNAWKRLVEFDAAVTIMATGDVNAELTLSRACTAGQIGACVFTWLEPNLSGAHLIYQPRGGPAIEALHEADATGRLRYRHGILDRPEDFIRKEAGCQTAFTPFAGADVMHFSTLAARKILAWTAAPPDHLIVLRWKPESGWEELS